MNKVSVVISNYNYGLFLASAIESALNQSYREIEIIVVDDGSTDQSFHVLNEYRGKVQVYSQPRRGECSTRNFGFAQSSGDFICFLDSDDLLDPGTAARIVTFWDARFSKVQYPLRVTDAAGASKNLRTPRCRLDQGDVLPRVLQTGRYITAPGRGNFYPQWLLQAIMPVSEEEWPQSFDSYAATQAAFYGEIGFINECRGSYRVHGRNISAALTEQTATNFQLDKLLGRSLRLKRLVLRLASERGLVAREDVVTGHWLYLKLALARLRLSPGLPLRILWSTVGRLAASALVASELTLIRRIQLVSWAFAAALTPGRGVHSVIDFGFDLAPRFWLARTLRRL